MISRKNCNLQYFLRIFFQCKLIDWQFAYISDPYFDIALITFFNEETKWINLDTNLKTYLKKYYDTIIPICKCASVQPPWKTFEDFEHKVFGHGFVALVI